MKLLMVRHAESLNNALGQTSDYSGTKPLSGGAVDDPELTPKGLLEAEALAAKYAPSLLACGLKAKIYTSPYLRTCQTSWPLFEALRDHGASAIVQPDIFANGGPREGGLSAAAISEMFPGYDVSKLPPSGPWYDGPQQGMEESELRAMSVASWLKSEELQSEVR
jgi:broad specificity phosphatase PhoE